MPWLHGAARWPCRVPQGTAGGRVLQISACEADQVAHQKYSKISEWLGAMPLGREGTRTCCPTVGDQPACPPLHLPLPNHACCRRPMRARAAAGVSVYGSAWGRATYAIMSVIQQHAAAGGNIT